MYIGLSCLFQIIGIVVFLILLIESNSPLAACIFGGIIFFSSIYFLKKNSEKTLKERDERFLRDKIDMEEKIIHIGGHPNLVKNQPILLQIREGNKLFLDNFILPENIIYCEVKTEEEVSRDVTLTRLITLGVFALAAKKEKRTTISYLVLSYKLDSIKIDCLFKQTHEKQNLAKLAYEINKLMQMNQ